MRSAGVTAIGFDQRGVCGATFIAHDLSAHKQWWVGARVGPARVHCCMSWTMP